MAAARSVLAAGSMGAAPILVVANDARASQELAPAIAPHPVTYVPWAELTDEQLGARAYAGWVLDIGARPHGLELLAGARARGDRRSALVLTTAIDRDSVNRAQELGAELVCKPYTAANIAAFLTRCASEPAAVIAGFVEQHELPRRQHDVVRALARGVRRPELAGELGVSENTIKSTIRALLRRTRYGSVEQLRCVLLRSSQLSPRTARRPSARPAP